MPESLSEVRYQLGSTLEISKCVIRRLFCFVLVFLYMKRRICVVTAVWRCLATTKNTKVWLLICKQLLKEIIIILLYYNVMAERKL